MCSFPRGLRVGAAGGRDPSVRVVRVRPKPFRWSGRRGSFTSWRLRKGLLVGTLVIPVDGLVATPLVSGWLRDCIRCGIWRKMWRKGPRRPRGPANRETLRFGEKERLRPGGRGDGVPPPPNPLGAESTTVVERAEIIQGRRWVNSAKLASG